MTAMPTPNSIHCGDCLDWLKSLPDNSVDLVLCSPPYETARLYGELQFTLKGQDWVDWCLPRFLECYRVCRGLTAWVVEGQTRQFQYSAAPALLMADLHRAGVKLRKPPIFHRVGIPGSGGPDWLRNDWEWIICATHGKLPWSDNTALGHPPKWAPGGDMSHRVSDGTRRNQWGVKAGEQADRSTNGSLNKRARPSHQTQTKRSFADKIAAGAKRHTKPDQEGMREQAYLPPPRANPGNVIHAIVGGGVMGHPLCHENEAPFPEDLAAFFIRSFCPEGGTTLDPFCGSGTTLAVADKWGRQYLGCDIRQSQVKLSKKRLAIQAKPLLP